MVHPETALLKTVNQSGFPLQLRVIEEIRQTHSQHGWTVVASEHPWNEPSAGRDGYADIVIRKNTMRLIIECKRALDKAWIFLIQPEKNPSQKETRILWTDRAKDQPDISGWDNFLASPSAPASSFCVVHSDGGDKRTNILEELSKSLLPSVEAIASQELDLARPRRNPGELRFYFPVVVTTAELRICTIDTAQIDLATGTVRAADFQIVPMVAFQKPLSTSFRRLPNLLDLSESNLSSERTIWIVNALKLVPILQQWGFRSLDHPNAQAWDVARRDKR